MDAEMSNNQDRRQHVRLKAKYGAYAAVESDYDKIGRIIDISGGGLAFSYSPGRKSVIKPRKLTILYSDEDYYLKAVPIKPVVDVQLENPAFTYIPLRKMSVAFQDMSRSQSALLETFLKNHTTR